MPTPKLSAIQQCLLNHLPNDVTQPLVAACSGGVDSIVLLHELAALANTQGVTHKIIVCYVNHGLSEQAVQWHNVVKLQCDQLGMLFVGKQVSLDTSSKQSLEAQARTARYLALKEVAGENGVVITAHHQDDQVETFLLALKRGAGIKGLGAMQTHSVIKTACGSLNIVRPLLTINRKEIEERALSLNLNWVEDESNTDQQFDRNFLRQTVIPLLNDRWAGIKQAIVRTSEHCQDAQKILDEVAREDLTRCLTPNNQLQVDQLLTLSESRFNYAIRYFLAQQQELMPSRQVLAQVKQQLLADADKTPQVKIGDKWLRRYKNSLMLTHNYAELSLWKTTVNLLSLQHTDVSVTLPDTLGNLVFSFDSSSANNHNSSVNSRNSSSNNSEYKYAASFYIPENITELTLCFSHDNPTCLPDFRQRSRSLKKVLQELDIPPWERKHIPLLFDENNTLLSAIGHFIVQPYHVEPKSLSTGSIKVNVHWLAGDNSG